MVWYGMVWYGMVWYAAWSTRLEASIQQVQQEALLFLFRYYYYFMLLLLLLYLKNCHATQQQNIFECLGVFLFLFFFCFFSFSFVFSSLFGPCPCISSTHCPYLQPDLDGSAASERSQNSTVSYCHTVWHSSQNAYPRRVLAVALVVGAVGMR